MSKRFIASILCSAFGLIGASEVALAEQLGASHATLLGRITKNL